MARKVKDERLNSREARRELKACGKPYYRLIEPGLHLGYRRLKDRGGTWLVRHYIGKQAYEVARIGTADDLSDADGVAILNFKQAQDEARKRMVSLAHTGKDGPLTVAAVMDAYLEYLETNGKSADTARYRAKAFIYPTLGHIEVEKLTTEQLRKWHAGIIKMAPRWRGVDHGVFNGDEEARRRRKVSANRIFSILQAALNRAFKEDKVRSDRAWRKVDMFKGVNVARTNFLTIPECQRLMNASEAQFRPLVHAALQTGCRFGELRALKARDFNPESGTIHIRTSKGGKARHVILTAEGVKLFKRLTAGLPRDALILRRDDGSPWKLGLQGRRIADACARANIDPPINFHQLRHTWASHAVMNGVPLMVVAKNLGHRDTKMVEQHYGHLAPSYIADEIRRGAPTFGIEPDTDVASLDERRRDSGQ